MYKIPSKSAFSQEGKTCSSSSHVFCLDFAIILPSIQFVPTYSLVLLVKTRKVTPRLQHRHRDDQVSRRDRDDSSESRFRLRLPQQRPLQYEHPCYLELEVQTFFWLALLCVAASTTGPRRICLLSVPRYVVVIDPMSGCNKLSITIQAFTDRIKECSTLSMGLELEASSLQKQPTTPTALCTLLSP
jgi:hypothetical protein